MMYVRYCEKFLAGLLAFIIFFAAPGPGELYHWLVKFPAHPSYLYANSEWQVCRRLRLVKENGTTKLYVENLSYHTLDIVLTQKRIRALIVFCMLEEEK